MNVLKNRNYENTGFTIVELLFVLAIAGLLFLLVFQAIPALQRNNKNTIRRQDVSTILGAVSHYELNNSGSLPQECGDGGGHPQCHNPVDPASPLYDTKLNYYDVNGSSSTIVIKPQSLIINPIATNRGPLPAVTASLDTVYVYNYEICNANNNGGASKAGAGYSDIVALYAVETGSGVRPQCQRL